MYRCAILAIALGLIQAEYALVVSNRHAKINRRGRVTVTQVGHHGELMAMLDTSTRVLTYEATYSGTGVAMTAGFCGTANGGKVGPQLIVLSDLDSPISGHEYLTENSGRTSCRKAACVQYLDPRPRRRESAARSSGSDSSTRTSNAPDLSQDPSHVNKNSSPSLGLQ